MRLSNALLLSKYILLSSRGWVYVAVGFTLIFPLLWLLLLRVVGNPQYMDYFVIGTVVNTSFLMPFIAVAQDIALMRHGSKLYSLLFANGASHMDIAMGYILQIMITLIPNVVSLLVVAMLIMGIKYPLMGIILTLLVSVIIILSSSLMGYALAMGLRNYRITNQISQVLPWPLLMLGPVYYPVSLLPPFLRQVSYALPTTYMALAVNGSLTLNLPNLVMGLLGLLVYSSASVLIARYAIIRGEVYG